MTQEFSGSDFVKALATGALKSQIVREGMAKLDEKDSKSILFAETLDCTNWVPIPVKMIEKVEFIHNLPCKDHQHPYVRIHFKSPTDNPEAEAFSRLLTTKPPTHAWAPGIESLSSLGPAQELPLSGLDFPVTHAHPQSAGSPGPQGGSVFCCQLRYECMPVAVTTASGQIAIVIKCHWVLTNCRPGPCSQP
jgi:hypothetical protein